jgi:hypothetical protein
MAGRVCSLHITRLKDDRATLSLTHSQHHNLTTQGIPTDLAPELGW